ncbi:hypothetical protein [Mesoterricola sediminis]|uniref:Uncharacterized protein n=1 Tax=Mesoterricola sediminis TaxID=2927980 RepID=A0AA48GY88_9BACT|nr:hypothetical protein [Mesoterricola sediminis]BDU76232.1 hypothetical protein METESE_11900 [Mesoterricola sediminis]
MPFDPEDAMPCGECCVCGEYLDHRDLGVCGECGQGFHFNRCGGWGASEHQCNNCKPDETREFGEPY